MTSHALYPRHHSGSMSRSPGVSVHDGLRGGSRELERERERERERGMSMGMDRADRVDRGIVDWVSVALSYWPILLY